MEQVLKVIEPVQLEIDRKNIAKEFFNLIGKGQFKKGLQFFTPECITHNPYFAGSISQLVDGMISANKDMSSKFPEAEFIVKHILADGDLVAVHTQLLSSGSKPENGGLRQVHVFRFKGDKIAEYWDVTQQILPDQPNAAGAF